MTYWLIALGAYAFCVLCWVLYLAIMNLAPHRHELHPVAKVHAYALLAVGLVMDAILHLVIGTILFLDLPRVHEGEWLLTSRLKRYHRRPLTWRGKMAAWICEHLLDQFDPKGDHC